MANKVLLNNEFYNKIALKSQFDFSNATGQIISDIIKISNLEFKVDLFYPRLFGSFMRYRKSLAYITSSYPNTLFLNARKLNRALAEIAATISHESIHALDDSENIYSFGHGNNSPVDKDNTEPYWIGNLAYSILTGHTVDSHLVFDQPEKDDGSEIA